MDQASTSEALVRPWRTATFVACSVAAVELVALLAIGIIVLGRPLLDRAQASARSSTGAATKTKRRQPSSATAAATVKRERLGPPKLSRSQTSVIVLNGNGVAGAAAAEAAAVRARGYRVTAVGNARRANYPRSVVVYRPGFKAEAVRLARDLGIGRVSPLDGMRRGEFQGARAALVVGR